MKDPKYPTNDELDEPDECEDEQEFVPCDNCDGHDACEDFGCAFELGLSRMVKKNTEAGNDNWSR